LASSPSSGERREHIQSGRGDPTHLGSRCRACGPRADMDGATMYLRSPDPARAPLATTSMAATLDTSGHAAPGAVGLNAAIDARSDMTAVPMSDAGVVSSDQLVLRAAVAVYLCSYPEPRTARSGPLRHRATRALDAGRPPVAADQSIGAV
jgi:hypothetical protein